MKKRILALVLVLCLVASVLPAAVSAASSGSCGDDVKWSFNASTGTLTLTGSGATDPYSRGETLPWADLKPQIKKVVVGEGITVLGYDFFKDCTALTEVELPGTLRELSSGDFRNCTGLTGILVLPPELRYLGGSVFRGSGLEGVIVTGELAYLGGYTFAECPNLAEVWFLGNAPETFGDDVFYGSTLYALYPDGNDTWNETNLLQYGGSVTWMRFDPETGEPIPDSVYWSFDETTGTLYIEGTGPMPGFLTDEQPWYDLREQILHVVVGEGITEIGNKAFYSRFYDLQTLTLPSTLMHIGDQAFYGCASLQNVTFPAGLKTIGNSAFGDCSTMSEVVLPDSVTLIGGGAFFRCTELTDLTLPAGLEVLGGGAFMECKKLANVTMPRVPDLTEVGEDVFHLCHGLTDVSFYTGSIISDGMFSYCNGLTEVTVPDSVTIIDDSAFFACQNMTRIVLGSRVKELGENALYNCEKLEQIIFTGNAPMIGEDAFGLLTANCYYPSNGANWTEEVLQSYGGTITWIPYNTGAGIPEPEPDLTGMCGDDVTWGFLERTGKLTLSGTGSTYDYRDGGPDEWDSFRDRIRSIEVKPGVTGLGTSIFDCCRNAETVTLHEGLKSIGMFAFWQCESLTEIVIPESVTEMAAAALRDCTSLRSVKLPSHLTRIPDVTFRNTGFVTYTVPAHITALGDGCLERCELLEQVILHDKITEIDDYAFAYDSRLRTVDWPAGVTKVQLGVFYESGLTELILPATVTKIEDYAFYQCEEFEKLYVLGDIASVGEYAFTDCTALTIYGRSGTKIEKYAKNNGIPFVVIDPARDFLDVPADSFYAEPVRWAVEKGITNGVGDFSFGPTTACNRAQVVTFLWRAEGCPEPTAVSNPFVDVKKSDFYYTAVLWAVEQGITNGADATHFNPLGVCNRAQVVTFLHRTFGAPAIENAANPFADVPEGTWYTAPVLWAVEQGITNGLSATDFGPNADCNRAQIVTFLYRAYND